MTTNPFYKVYKLHHPLSPKHPPTFSEGSLEGSMYTNEKPGTSWEEDCSVRVTPAPESRFSKAVTAHSHGTRHFLNQRGWHQLTGTWCQMDRGLQGSEDRIHFTQIRKYIRTRRKQPPGKTIRNRREERKFQDNEEGADRMKVCSRRGQLVKTGIGRWRASCLPHPQVHSSGRKPERWDGTQGEATVMSEGLQWQLTPKDVIA